MFGTNTLEPQRSCDILQDLLCAVQDDDIEKFKKLEDERPALAKMVIYMLDNSDLWNLLLDVLKEAGAQIEK